MGFFFSHMLSSIFSAKIPSTLRTIPINVRIQQCHSFERHQTKHMQSIHSSCCSIPFILLVSLSSLAENDDTFFVVKKPEFQWLNFYQITSINPKKRKKKESLRRDKQNLTHSNLHMKNRQHQPAQKRFIENVDRRKKRKRSQHSLMSWWNITFSYIIEIPWIWWRIIWTQPAA